MTLADDRFYLTSDGGSFYFEPGGDNDGFETVGAAIAWAAWQLHWPELVEFLDDGMAAMVCLGSDLNENELWTQAWADRDGSLDELADAPPVRNHYRKGAAT